MQETTDMTLFELLYGRYPTTVLDAILRHVEVNDMNIALQQYLQRAEEARRLLEFLQCTNRMWTETGTATVNAETPRVTQEILSG